MTENRSNQRNQRLLTVYEQISPGSFLISWQADRYVVEFD
ncbi:MAG: hypothetical protein GQF41_1743 [Candidatus Rifleibacterium amylolyticum]|nr:MAG: hypothetical protein GQF41_1743 [Candidatus Rifleibacterium amylolyticum]